MSLITPPARADTARAVFRRCLAWLAKLAARQADTRHLWSYYWDTIDACVSPGRVLHTLEVTGFSNVRHHLELGIFSEYRAQKPVY